jgi:hypothetical protein
MRRKPTAAAIAAEWAVLEEIAVMPKEAKRRA